MKGSDAVAGWLSSSGAGIVKRYSLGGYSSGECPPDQGNLVLVEGSSVIVSRSSRLYLAFQLNTSQPSSNLIYALGPNGRLPSSDFLLPTHQTMISTSINYATGNYYLSETILLSTIHHYSSVSNSENNCRSEYILGRKDIGGEETSRDNRNGGMGSHLARRHRHCTLRKALGSFLVLRSYLSSEFWLHSGNCLRRRWL